MSGQALVIIPTYNESGNVARMVEEFVQLSGIELLIIDDNSPDGTATIVKDLQTKHSFVHLIQRSGKLGLGTAYIAGFRWALEKGYTKIISMDCDFSHDPKSLPEMVRNLETHSLVIGSRYVNGIRIMNWPFSRLLLSYGASLYTRIITGIPFLDPTGGFNGYSAPALKALDLSKVFSIGYAFQIELKYKIWSKGFKCMEMPIVFWERREGASKMGRKIVIEAVINVIRLRLKKTFGSL